LPVPKSADSAFMKSFACPLPHIWRWKRRNHRLRRLHRFLFFLRVPSCNFVANFL